MTKKAWQEEVRQSAHKIWLAGLGALAVAEEEGSKLFSSLVQEGEKFEATGKKKVEELRKEVGAKTGDARQAASSAWSKVEEGFDEGVARALRRVGVPTREEIGALSRRVEELTAAVERLREQAAKPVAKPAEKPAATPGVTTREDVTTTADVATRQRKRGG